MQQILPYIVVAVAVVLFVWMLWLAAKEKLTAALLVGALCTMCIGLFPALHLSFVGQEIAETVQGAEGVQEVQASPVKNYLSIVLWLVLFAVPGPFLAVVAQVFFRLIKRVRAANAEGD